MMTQQRTLEGPASNGSATVLTWRASVTPDGAPVAGAIITAQPSMGRTAEVSAVNSVDDRTIPCPGPMTTAIAAEYAKTVRGEVDTEWIDREWKPADVPPAKGWAAAIQATGNRSPRKR